MIIHHCSNIIQDKRQGINVEILNFYDKSILLSRNPKISKNLISNIIMLSTNEFSNCISEIYQKCGINPFQYHKIPQKSQNILIIYRLLTYVCIINSTNLFRNSISEIYEKYSATLH